MGPIWGCQDPGGPHVGPINFAIWEVTHVVILLENKIICLTHCGPVLPYRSLSTLDQVKPHYPWYQAITLTNADFSLLGFSGFSWEQFHSKCPSYYSVWWNWTLCIKITKHLPRANELILFGKEKTGSVETFQKNSCSGIIWEVFDTK